MTLKSITSGNLVEARIKQRQKNGLETSPTDPLDRGPDFLGPSSKKYSASHRRGSEFEDAEAPSDQVIDLTMGSAADPVLILEEQRRDIDRIMANINILQQDMKSLRESVELLEDRRDRASHDLAGDVDILTDNITTVSSRLGELDALNLGMKMMQQRIKRMEESKSMRRRSSTVLDSAQVSRRPSPTIGQPKIPCNDAPPNGLLLSEAQRSLSAYSDGLFTPWKTASETTGVGDTTYQGLTSDFKDESLSLQTPSITIPKTSVNGIGSNGNHTPVNMPPPRIPRKGPDPKSTRHGSLAASNAATPRNVSTSVTGTTNSTSLPRLISQLQEASSSSHHDHPESHIYDDELVDDTPPRSFTGSSAGNARQPAKNTAHSRQNKTKGTAQQLPPKSQKRQSLPTRLPALEREKRDGPDLADLNKQDPRRYGRTTHHDTQRQKATAISMDAPSTSIWATDSRDSGSRSGRRNEQSPLVRVNGEPDGRSTGSRSCDSKKRKLPENRDEDGYLLTPDGTRDPRSVKSLDSWKKRKGEAELSG